METYKIQYFLAAARWENLNKAATETHSSAPAISKAIKALEEDLGTKLFFRSGRNIKLTDSGRHFQIRGNEIIDLLHSVKSEFSSAHQPKKFRIAGREFLLAEYGLMLIDQLKLFGKSTQIELVNCSGEEGFKRLADGDVDCAVSIQVPHVQFKSKVIGKFQQVTCIAKNHLLMKKLSKSKQKVTIAEVLMQPFVSPNEVSFVKSGARQSIDGWRDDKFPRQIAWRTDSVELLTELISSGRALAYVPDFWAAKKNLHVLDIENCEFVCKAQVFASFREGSPFIRNF